ncbi:MAG TPA: hypothetical protein ENJ28_04890 [Gammaproteobacteria bacterium]|nr:hypothetical protein [Gammaproteobacteria bacterium]
MATEDLTTYTEVDGNGDLTVTTSKVDFTTMPANVTDYLYDDKGASHWSGDFNIDFDFELTATNGANVQGILTSISNTVGIPNDSTSFMTYFETSSLTPYLADIDSAGNWDSWAGGSNLSLNTIYYCTLSRTGNTLDWDIYSNSSRTTLVQNITIAITNTAQTFRYVYPVSSIAIGDGSDVTGYVQNLDLNEAVASGIPIFRRRIEARKTA